MSKQIVTKKQKAIQTLIYSFRFLNSKQIQEFLSHKDHRRVNAWLKDLTDKGYLKRDFTARFGTSTKPAVYYLAAKGRKYIRETYLNATDVYLERISDDKNRSKAFRSRCQMLADYYLIIFEGQDLVENLENYLTKGVKLRYNKWQFFTPAFFEELDFPLIPHLKLDGYFYKRLSSGIIHTGLYVLDAYVPRVMLNYTLKNIFKVVQEEYWEDETVLVLQFYFVCPNHMVIVYLCRLLTSFLENYYGKEVVFHFATRNQLYAKRRDRTKPTGWVSVSSKN